MLYMLLAVLYTRDFSVGWAGCERALRTAGFTWGILPDSGCIESEGNTPWALQSSAPTFMSTYCLLRVPLGKLQV